MEFREQVRIGKCIPRYRNSSRFREGECGVGTFDVKAADIELNFSDANWIFYEFDWSEG